jgi:FKBP-type peptidyl-prolyl cis-trans isomerase
MGPMSIEFRQCRSKKSRTKTGLKARRPGRGAETFVGLFAIGMMLFGCTIEKPFPAVSGEQPNATQQRYLDWNGKRDGWMQSGSGLQSHRLSAANPSGAVPGPDSIITAQCEGRFIDGRLFFATPQNRPLIGPLHKVVKGWQEGLQLMHVGETWEFALPPALAYGEKGWHSQTAEIPSIPPQTALLFKIELLDVTKPAPSNGKTP